MLNTMHLQVGSVVKVIEPFGTTHLRYGENRIIKGFYHPIFGLSPHPNTPTDNIVLELLHPINHTNQRCIRKQTHERYSHNRFIKTSGFIKTEYNPRCLELLHIRSTEPDTPSISPFLSRTQNSTPEEANPHPRENPHDNGHNKPTPLLEIEKN